MSFREPWIFSFTVSGSGPVVFQSSEERISVLSAFWVWTMADDIPRKQLWDEITCTLCLEFFTNPVVLDCGHNFCKECILGCWGKPPTFVCPECQVTVPKKILLPNYQLRNIVDIAQQLDDQAVQEAEVWGDCERHQEPLKFFCKDDKVPLCVLCKKLKRHKEHHVLLVEAAAEEYKVRSPPGCRSGNFYCKFLMHGEELGPLKWE